MEISDKITDYLLESSTVSIDESILRYENFVENVLKKDLQKLSVKYEKFSEQITNYNNIKSTIDLIKQNDLKSLKTMNDLGSNCYVQCVIPNTDRIYLCVGLDCFVELTLDEALKFINFKTDYLKKSIDNLMENISKIKAHIKIILNLIDQLRNSNNSDS